MRLFEHPDFDQAVLRAAEHVSSARGSSKRTTTYRSSAYHRGYVGDKVIFKGGTKLSKG